MKNSSITIMLALATAIALPMLANAQTITSSFHGYACTKDCSGHKAGYAWAQRKGIKEAGGCTGSSKSFREGCQVWVNEQAQTASQAKPNDQ